MRSALKYFIGFFEGDTPSPVEEQNKESNSDVKTHEDLQNLGGLGDLSTESEESEESEEITKRMKRE